MAYKIMAHPTTYRETVFRSRLEARWAAFFDEMGWQWLYEPLELDNYVPDFMLLGARKVVVEVRPMARLDDEHAVSGKSDLMKVPEGHDLLVLGLTPCIPVCGFDPNKYKGNHLFAFGLAPLWGARNEVDWKWDACVFVRPAEHSGYRLDFADHYGGLWTGKMSGIHDKYGYLDDDAETRAFVDAAWARAGNATQYDPPQVRRRRR